jgi:hypothetical protein
MANNSAPPTCPSSPSKFNRLLTWIATAGGLLLLVLIAWLGYLNLLLAKLVQPGLEWVIRPILFLALAAVVWQGYRLARRRRFRFSVRTLLIAICVLSALLAVASHLLLPLRQQQLAARAVSHLSARNGVFTIGSPTHALDAERRDWTDLRNAVSVSFTGITLTKTDFQQLARLPSLAAITIKNAPIREDAFLLLQHLPNLTFLVLENTNANADTLQRIESMRPNWHAFPSDAAMKQWAIARAKK